MRDKFISRVLSAKQRCWEASRAPQGHGMRLREFLRCSEVESGSPQYTQQGQDGLFAFCSQMFLWSYTDWYDFMGLMQ